MNRFLTRDNKSRAWDVEILKTLFLLLMIFMIVGCVFNEPWRTGNSANPCQGDSCGTTLIEQHKSYDLAFVEFTERGNVFDRKKLETVLAHVDGVIKENQGTTVIVFVHGWKNNASTTNPNVKSFRQLLKKTALLGEQGAFPRNRKIMGVYIGWRGQSLDIPYLNTVTYWDRKAVAEQVGKGGVTELLLRLEHMVKNTEDDPNKNLYLVTGHSFGGAVVLSALHEVMLERVVAAKEVEVMTDDKKRICFKSRHFGHGVVLLNPAIEANEMLQLKELVAQKCFIPSQDRLMHVISSDADIATNLAFRAGQWIGVNLSWSQAEIGRELGGKSITLDERDLDTITVGNFSSFRTGRLTGLEQLNNNKQYDTCIKNIKCVNSDEQRNHIPAKHNEPLAFIFSNSEFIEGHNDVFNPKVAAYLATIVTEARAKRILALEKSPKPDRNADDKQYYEWYENNRKEMVQGGIFEKCLLQNKTVDKKNTVNLEKVITGDPFDFGMCFDRYREVFKA